MLWIQKVSSMKFLLQWIQIFCAAHTEQRTAGVNGRFASVMDVRRCTAKRAARDCGMVHEIVLFIHARACTANEQQRIAVVQLSHLVRGQQFFATLSSDEFKKTAAAKKNLCGCRSNWRLEAKKSPVVPGK